MKLRLRELREAKGITPRQMYERIGVQDSRYRKWESETAAIPLEFAIACCDVLGCTLDELAGRKPISLSAEERELLSCYQGSNPQGREAIMAVARASSGVEGQSKARVSA